MTSKAAKAAHMRTQVEGTKVELGIWSLTKEKKSSPVLTRFESQSVDSVVVKLEEVLKRASSISAEAGVPPLRTSARAIDDATE